MIRSARSEGFTLIELLIVISLIIILSASMIPRFTGYMDSQNLRQAQEQVKSDLRSAAVRALSGVGAQNTNLAYWGVLFNTTSPNNTKYEIVACRDTTCVPGVGRISTQTSEVLPGNIIVYSLTATTNNMVLFDVSNGDRFYSAPATETVIRLRVGTTNSCACVRINNVGLVRKAACNCT